MTGEWRFNPCLHRAEGDRLVRGRVLPVCDNDCGCRHTAGHLLVEYLNVDDKFN